MDQATKRRIPAEAKESESTVPLLQKDRRSLREKFYRYAILIFKILKRRFGNLAWVVGFIFLIILSGAILVWITRNENQSKHATLSRCSSSSSYNKFVVSSDAKECSLIGCEILNEGGNAIDAAIATAICSTVVNPYSTSISGGAFLLYHSSMGYSKFFDMREVAGSKSNQALYENSTINKKHGAGSICTANMVKHFYEIWKKYGKMPWKRLIEPSVIVAREGFTITHSLSAAISTMKIEINKYPELRSFLKNKKSGDYLGEGDLYKDEVYAKTLTRIAEDENYVTYELDNILQSEICGNFVKEYPGIECPLMVEDFKENKLIEYDALETNMSSRKVLYGDITSSGILVQFMLKILDFHNITPLYNANSDRSADYFHILTETFKWAYSKRGALGDYADIGNNTLLEQVIKFYQSNEEAKRISETKIIHNAHKPEYYEPTGYLESDHGTSHLSVIDKYGNTVSLTTSVNYYFGSLMRSPTTGIIYNNAMDDFSVESGINYYGLKGCGNNLIKPRRKPFSSMSPIIMLDKDQNFELSIGGSGGSHIPTAVTGVISNYIFRNLSLRESIYSPRIHHQLYPDVLQNDEGYPMESDVVKKLTEKGHNFLSSPFYSAVQAVSKVGSKLYGEADPRKDGCSYGV